MPKIKIWERSHGSPITTFSLYVNVYKHMNGDFTKDKIEKSQYQDTICSETEEGHGDRPWEVLYNYIVNPVASQPSEETSEVFPLMERTFPLAFMELVTAGKHILRPLRTIFVSYNNLCHLANTVVGNMRAR